jgi:RNA polymerase I, Rpa2 specific domain
VERLRRFKCNVRGARVVPANLEVALMTRQDGKFYAALYLFTTPARMMRPVLNLRYGKVEQIGSLEQMFLSVACVDGDIKLGRTSHKEVKPNNMLSVIANLTPFSDFNQSPRNMYQVWSVVLWLGRFILFVCVFCFFALANSLHLFFVCMQLWIVGCACVCMCLCVCVWM